MFAGLFKRHHKMCKALPCSRLPRWLGLTVLIMILITGLSYVMTVNAVATQGYQIKTLQGQLADLKEVNKKMEVASANLQSLKTIADDLPKDGFITVERLEYLAANPAEVGVAVK